MIDPVKCFKFSPQKIQKGHFNCKVVNSGVAHRYGLGILTLSSTGTILDIPMGQRHFMIHSTFSYPWK